MRQPTSPSLAIRMAAMERQRLSCGMNCLSNPERMVISSRFEVNENVGPHTRSVYVSPDWPSVESSALARLAASASIQEEAGSRVAVGLLRRIVGTTRRELFPGSQRLKMEATSSIGSSLKLHSQTTATRQPCSSSSKMTRSSRSAFLFNLPSQKEAFDDGVVFHQHPGCLCQKQP